MIARALWEPPRISEADAHEQAMALVERWHRIFIRNVRALRDLLRYVTPV